MVETAGASTGTAGLDVCIGCSCLCSGIAAALAVLAERSEPAELKVTRDVERCRSADRSADLAGVLCLERSADGTIVGDLLGDSVDASLLLVAAAEGVAWRRRGRGVFSLARLLDCSSSCCGAWAASCSSSRSCQLTVSQEGDLPSLSWLESESTWMPPTAWATCILALPIAACASTI